MKHLFLIFSIPMLFFSLHAKEWEEVYQAIPDLCSPTQKDFLTINRYLKYGKRDYLKWLNFKNFDPSKIDGAQYDVRMRKLNIGTKNLELKIAKFQNTPEITDTCVVSYVSVNKKYKRHLLRIESELEKIGFDGHFLYRIGGWPDIEGGALKYTHVPYSFKLCMVREAIRLGYKKIIWIDSSVLPLNKFMTIYDYLEKDGYFLIDHLYPIESHDSPKVVETFSLTDQDRNTIHQIVGGCFGFDVSNAKVNQYINECFTCMDELNGFLSPRPEQVAMGIIAYRMGLFPQLPFTEVFTWDNKGVEEPYHLFKVLR